MQAKEIGPERAEFLKRVDKLPQTPSEPIVTIYEPLSDIAGKFPQVTQAAPGLISEYLALLSVSL